MLLRAASSAAPCPTPTKSAIVYPPGAVHIGATWNRYGESASDGLGDDWSRALAHELGHYLFFLNDNYLGLDKKTGALISMPNCAGAMADPYQTDDENGYDEFSMADAAWTENCQEVLSMSAGETGRADWDTILTFYPGLHKPISATQEGAGDRILQRGPNTLPLDVTVVNHIPPQAPAAALDLPIFALVNAHGGRVLPGVAARAFLLKADAAHVVDLGRSRLDQVLARGAAPGDRLCIFDPVGRQQGCKEITANDNRELVMQKLADDWQPDVRGVTGHFANANGRSDWLAGCRGSTDGPHHPLRGHAAGGNRSSPEPSTSPSRQPSN